MTSHTMTAATFGKTGPASDVLEIRNVDRPDPGPAQVRVRMVVSAVNPTDVKIRSGYSPREIDGFQVPHMDGSGVIDAVGPGVSADRIGERVWVMLAADRNRWGTAAQWCVVPGTHAVVLPESASFDLGATLGVPAVTAAHCLFADGPITGRDVLVCGGAGAVGRAAIQLARWAGARVVATVSGPEKAEVARSAGAHHVVNYRDPDALDQLRVWAPRVDRVVEVALADNLDQDLALCHPGTVVVTYAIDGPDPVIPVRRAMGAGATFRFMLLYTVDPPSLAEAVAQVGAAVRDGALDLPPVRRFSLGQIVEAHEAQEAGPLGKILLAVDGESFSPD
jgi:NADPH2:quinone reductase